MERTYENQNKTLETTSGVNAHSLSLFNQNSHFSYIYKKTEKLVTALYMITNFIKDNEPLKWKLRDNALKLLSLNGQFTHVSLSERKDLIKEYQVIAFEIISLSSIASHGGLVSEMNASVLVREFNSLISLIEKDENKKMHDETVVLDSGFFKVGDVNSQTFQNSPKAEIAQVPTTHTENNVLYSSQVQEGIVNKGQVSPVVQQKSYAKTEPVSKEVKEKVVKQPDQKNNRQAIIIKLLSKKSGLNIKDFGDAIVGVGAKTIQRELLSMVASGKLKKEGERRWSTYSLAE